MRQSVLLSHSGFSNLKVEGRKVTLIQQFLRFIRNDSGATAVEYSIMAVAIAAVIISVVFAIGTEVNEGFETFNSDFSGLAGS
jgi:pilus assembly protein Flp/PilA